MNDTLNDIEQITALQHYLHWLYGVYDLFQADYKNLHKRSQMHDTESIGDYYLRWKDKMKKEICRVEKMLLELLPPIQLRTLNDVDIEVQSIEKNRLQIVAIHDYLTIHY